MALGAAALPLASCASLTGRGRQRPPNVLFILDDQLRADACGVYGGRNIETPHIDRLAAEGVTFTNAVSSCPLCTPYRGMLMTGRYPTHTGIVLNFVEAEPDRRCLARVFRDAGYATGYVGKWHLAAGRMKRAGKFAMTDQQRRQQQEQIQAYVAENPHPEFVPPGPRRLGFDYWQAYNFHMQFLGGFYYEDEPTKLHWPGWETDGQTDHAIAFMDRQRAADKPFFLVVSPHPPHPPFHPDICPPGYLDAIPKQLHWSPNVPEDHPRRRDPLAARCYYAMAKNIDDNVGRLLHYLNESGLDETTILVFTADHGEMHGSHGRQGKLAPYAESVNVPLILRWPRRLTAGRRVDTLYTPLDHLPTLCSLAGLETPSGLDGYDLSSTLLDSDDRVPGTTGGAGRNAVLMANYVSNFNTFDTGTIFPEWRAVRTRSHTYIKWLAEGREELYDNRADPYQLLNLAVPPRDERVLAHLRGRLQDLLAEAHDEFLPGTAYASWYDEERNLIRGALGPA
jgi:arylsulfatase A-like enzyme